eukprot:366295-Chlamydomonas_euryale.AAC.7
MRPREADGVCPAGQRRLRCCRSSWAAGVWTRTAWILVPSSLASGQRPRWGGSASTSEPPGWKWGVVQGMEPPSQLACPITKSLLPPPVPPPCQV